VTIARQPLGKTGIEVSVLGFGAMELRGTPGHPVIPDEQAGQLLTAVLDGGINLIDTSIDYGRSEELIGRYLAGRRDEYFLASKCGCPAPQCWMKLRPRRTLHRQHDYRPLNVRAGVEASLRRLRTDRLDVVQVHHSPSRTQLAADHTIETLTKLRDQGKVRFIGMSGTLPNLPAHIAMGVFDVFQIPYSAVQREHADLIAKAAEAGAGTLIRGGVARGGPAKDWQAEPLSMPSGVAQRRWNEANLADLLDGMSPAEFMLRYTISHPGLSATIVGTSKLEHLQANLAIAAKGPLPAGLYAEASRRLDSVSTGSAGAG
jgi:aryl-alcohol dehydrogenase-like predicted oxidoreductase